MFVVYPRLMRPLRASCASAAELLKTGAVCRSRDVSAIQSTANPWVLLFSTGDLGGWLQFLHIFVCRTLCACCGRRRRRCGGGAVEMQSVDVFNVVDSFSNSDSS